MFKAVSTFLFAGHGDQRGVVGLLIRLKFSKTSIFRSRRGIFALISQAIAEKWVD